jgi:dissimilatory sulfite reductase (desulfoviridin) alpha/beta subunit
MVKNGKDIPPDTLGYPGLSKEDFPSGSSPNTSSSEDTLTLDLSPRELEKASLDILPSNKKAKDATQTLTEAPLPIGANINSDRNTHNLLEPVLAQTMENNSNPLTDRILPPNFLSRLGAPNNPKKEITLKIKKEGTLSWSLTQNDAWPVFAKREVLNKPTTTQKLKEIARVSKRFGANRLCLSPQGDLDIFFNDRKSLEDASTVLNTVLDGQNVSSSLISTCRGLMFCPYAALDTMEIKDALSKTLDKKTTKKLRSLVQISVHGCTAGKGFSCGLIEYTDLRIVGKRDRPPLINQELLSTSPHIDKLIKNCRGQALTKSDTLGKLLDLNKKTCLRCGYCLSVDPSFQWSWPQGSYFSLELSGRRLNTERDFIPPKVLYPEIRENRDHLFQRISELLKVFLENRQKDEILHDFMERTHLLDFLS